jgi:A/G-specific adenine glycosylase
MSGPARRGPGRRPSGDGKPVPRSSAGPETAASIAAPSQTASVKTAAAKTKPTRPAGTSIDAGKKVRSKNVTKLNDPVVPSTDHSKEATKLNSDSGASKRHSKRATKLNDDARSSGVLTWEDRAWRDRVRRKLLRWFDTNARKLPWRDDPQPYHVWVSEVMLQQTQVATVIDYYHRFLAAFPTIESLAQADEGRLMRLWEGLGYYRRARALQGAAKRVVQSHGGLFPQRFEEVLALPGIGRYTAGAILSISGDQRLPVLEGNTVRVYSRWVGLREDVTSTSAQRTLWQVAEAMLPARSGSGRFNQAAMELGALICKPRDPDCDACPVRDDCRARDLGLQGEIPGKVKRIEYQSRDEYAFVVPVDQGGVLMVQIPKGERWAGLWDVPRWTAGGTGGVESAAEGLSRRFGIDLRPRSLRMRIKHAVTRYRINLEVHDAQPIAAADVAIISTDNGAGDSGAGDSGDWDLGAGVLRIVPLDRLADLPLSTTGRKIARDLLKSPPDIA